MEKSLFRLTLTGKVPLKNYW